MDVWGAIVVLARRFYITVPLAALTIIGAYSYTHKTAGEYHAAASMVLIGPTAVVDRNNPGPVNPFAGIGTPTVAAAIQVDATSPRSMSQIIAAHNSTNFSVAPVGRTSVLSITATSINPRQALSTVAQVIGIVQADLVARQRPYTTQTTQQVTTQVLSAPQLQALDTKARTRAEAIGIGSAIVVTILLVLVLDAILAERQRAGRRSLPVEEGDLDEPGPQRTSVVRS